MGRVSDMERGRGEEGRVRGGKGEGGRGERKCAIKPSTLHFVYLFIPH